MIKTRIRQTARREWNADWENRKTGKALRIIQPAPSASILKIHSNIERSMTSLITQIRIEKIGLETFLQEYGVPGFNILQCECGGGKQTASDVLSKCKIYTEER